MSDIAPRPWRIAPGFEHDYIKSADGSVVSVENQPHVVACVNAIYAAGITPEALARDPECVAKLVEVVVNQAECDDPACAAFPDSWRDCNGCRAIKALRACGIESEGT